MLTVKEIKWHLEDANLRKVSERSGVSYSAIYRLMTDDSHEPLYRTVKRLSDYIKARGE